MKIVKKIKKPICVYIDDYKHSRIVLSKLIKQGYENNGNLTGNASNSGCYYIKNNRIFCTTKQTTSDRDNFQVIHSSDFIRKY